MPVIQGDGVFSISIVVHVAGFECVQTSHTRDLVEKIIYTFVRLVCTTAWA